MTTKDVKSEKRPTVLITGGSKGIGFELAKQFATHGYNLVLAARSETDLRQAAGQLENEYGCGVTIYPIDLAADDSSTELHRQLIDKGIQVDVLVNNAGKGGARRISSHHGGANHISAGTAQQGICLAR
ncbi:MAG: SDR family NAD(P)-dependent oxidoreductase [Candidatus Thiodiazotropha endolucinida]